MKIVKQIRDIHAEYRPCFEDLAEEVKGVLKQRAEEKNWFFLARVKEIESFALKIETGRILDPAKMEDFFACTIVVPTMVQIDEAEKLVLSLYDLVNRRPKDDAITHKASSNFVFDDLRLYVARRPLTSGKNSELEGIVFEVQIKTILQYAWSVATHDLIYKSDTVSWPRERIAFQVKAMLEHAEVAIAEATQLADAPAVAKKDKWTSGILQLIEQFNNIWPRERLPTDIKRLAETIFDVLNSCDLNVDRFSEIIRTEENRLGILPADLSPYALTIQAIAQNNSTNFEHKFNRRHIRTKILIHSGMELPSWMLETHPRIINISK
jgi:ppGpp synthetase/RelA/SpoT-type nucleotidyltranferase